MEIRRVAVIGAGSMGRGIAQVAGQAGYQVSVYESEPAVVSKAREDIEGSLAKFVEKGKISAEEREQTLNRISWSKTLAEAVSEADLVIEAVFENLNLKQDIFRSLDLEAPKEAILASNTSSLPITAIAAVTKRTDRVLGMHFMNPVPLMKGVEIIEGRMTAPEVMDTAAKFIEDLGKVPARAKDYAGFIASRVLDVMLNEAVYCVMDGNEPSEIDKAMKVCCNFPMGPLELIDLAGADILLNVMDILTQEFGDKYKPAPLLRQMVRAGHLGRKTGQGFYRYK